MSDILVVAAVLGISFGLLSGIALVRWLFYGLMAFHTARLLGSLQALESADFRGSLALLLVASASFLLMSHWREMVRSNLQTT